MSAKKVSPTQALVFQLQAELVAQRQAHEARVSELRLQITYLRAENEELRQGVSKTTAQIAVLSRDVDVMVRRLEPRAAGSTGRGRP